MNSSRSSHSDAKKGVSPPQAGPLRALRLIESVGDVTPFSIVPVDMAEGAAMAPADRMAAKVRWAERATYAVLTQDVPADFAPYNSVIRVSERGTEDMRRDYLAQLVFDEDSMP